MQFKPCFTKPWHTTDYANCLVASLTTSLMRCLKMPTKKCWNASTTLQGLTDGTTARQPSNAQSEKATLIDVVRTLYAKGKEYASKLFSRTHFDVAQTPKFMKELGLKGDKFTIRYGVITRHFDKDKSHKLTEDDWQKLPNALQNPFAITKNSKEKGSYRIYTSMQNSNGEYVVVGVDVKNVGRNIEVNAISTIFGRRENANLTVDEEVIYISEEITPEQSSLLERPNFAQYPTEQELSDSKDSELSQKSKEDAEENKKPRLEKADSKTTEVSSTDALLRDAVVNTMEESGIKVITNNKAAQSVLDRENKKTPLTGQPNRANEKPTSGSVLASIRRDSSSNPTTSKQADTKIKNDTQSAKNKIKKYFNGDFLISNKDINQTFADLGKMFAMQDKGGSRYSILQTNGGKTIAIRISNHNAKGDNFEQDNADNNLSIVVERYKYYNANNSNIEYTEVTIPYEVYQTKPTEVIDAIVNGVNDTLADKEFSLSSELGTVEKKGGEQAYTGNKNVRFFRTANGEAYGFTVDGKIYLDPTIAGAETAIHEYTHLWATALKSANPKEWSNIVSLLKGTPLWDKVASEYPELTTDDELADEVLAHYSGKRGAERLRKEAESIANGKGSLLDKAGAISALERVKEALTRFWKATADLLHIHFTTAEEVADKVLADLLNGVNPNAMQDRKELIAVHNITEDKLKKALSLGGFPMPSIAITKAEIGHETFGDISLIFDKESIDPTDKRNKVYGEDAWTPVFPNVGYKLNDDKTSTIYSKANKAGHLPMFNPVDFHQSNYENKIDERGDESLVERFKEDYGAKQLYLSETGNAVKEFVQHEVEKYSPESVALYEKLLKDIGIERLKNENYESLKDEIKQLINQHYGIDIDSKKPFLVKTRIQNTIHHAIDYAENGNLKTESDIDATKAKIDGRIDDEKFVKWLEKLFAGVVEKKGIRNDRDWFTSSGNRRKWEQLYDEITLDNVVDAMQKQASKGGEGLFGGSIFGSAQKEYSSIDEIRNSAKERIQAINEDDYQAQRDAITNRLSSIEIPGAGRGFSGTMDMIQNIQDAVTKSHTAKGIHKYLKRFYPKVTLEIAKEIEGIVKDIQRMSARYFEAKPYRAVGFEEVRLAIVPSDTDASLVEQLKQKGIEIRTYERGNQKQRKQIADEATRELNLRFQFIGEQGAEESTSGEDTKNPTWEEITDALESTPTSHTEVPGVKMHSSKSDTAKIHNNEAIAKDLEKLGESFNNNYAFSAKEFIGQLALRFNIPANTENTSYKQIQTPNGKITVRLSNHQGNAINFILKNSNNQNNYGIVIKTERNLFKDNENVNYLELVYFGDIVNGNSELQKAITLGLSDFIRTGSIKDMPKPNLLNASGSFKKKMKEFGINRKLEYDDGFMHRTLKEIDAKQSSSAIVDSVRSLADRLHLGNVEIVTDASALSGKEAKAKGFYSKSTGKITIVIPNNTSAEDAVQTLLHEAVAHYGLRKLFGSEFDNFLDAVLENADKEVLERIYDLAQANGWDYRKATEEYLATLAETTEFENTDKGWWNKVKKLFVDMLRTLGIKALDGTTLTDNELRYILWASYQNLKGNNETLIGIANDIVKREDLGIENTEDDKLLRSDEEQPISYEQAMVRDLYDQRMASGVYQSIEALQDSMRSVKEFMGMVDKAENGKARYIEDIDDFENAYLGENRLSSQNKAETDLSANLLLKPLLRAMTIWIFQHINCHKIHSEYIKGQ